MNILTIQARALPLLMGLTCIALPFESFAAQNTARNAGFRAIVRQYPTLLTVVLLSMAALFLYGAYSNKDWVFDSTPANFLEKIIGRTGLRVMFGAIGLTILGVGSQLVMGDSVDSFDEKPMRCGQAGTQSFITDEGICDCMPGYTWADEDDETSVVCILE